MEEKHLLPPTLSLSSHLFSPFLSASPHPVAACTRTLRLVGGRGAYVAGARARYELLAVVQDVPLRGVARTAL
eukprot:1054504-Rhodomonas_salina.1